MTEPTALVDANVLLDIALGDPDWRDWSAGALAAAREQGPIAINQIILAELAPAYASAESLDRALPASRLVRLELPFECAWVAGQAFVAYRRAGGERCSPLPDFYIGAHAQVAGLSLISRDPRRYRSYFPGLRLVSP